jgi:hypothetical protein
MTSIEQLVSDIQQHRCYHHPVFERWAANRPSPEVIGALFHQIQSFCASTRPGWNLPDALRQHGLDHESDLLQEIVESEEDHGPELARMAGFIVNQAAGETVFPDVYDQQAVEAGLREYSDRFLGSLPGYDPDDGLMVQTRRAIAVFDRRKETDIDSTYRNLGTALALEMISNNHLIPGEKTCLVDTGTYGASMDQDEMHYLLEHYGETGAEQQHEKNAVAAVGAVLDDKTEPLIRQGAMEFLESLSNLWDLLDSALLQSGDGREGETRELAGVS